MTRLTISTQFDSGSIGVLRLEDPRDIALHIRKDNASEFAQWFHFALHGAADMPVTLKFLNAGQCAYPKGWNNYRVVASHDRQNWFRIETSFDDEVMTARTTPQTQCIYFAYFEPYSYEQHLDLLASLSRILVNGPLRELVEQGAPDDEIFKAVEALDTASAEANP